MKTYSLYLIEHDGDVICISEPDLRIVGKTKADVDAEYGEVGRWVELNVKPATAKLDREIAARAQVKDDFAGFRQDPLLLPAARFNVLVDTWDGKAPESDTFDNLAPNVADRIDFCLRAHLRPQGFDASFFTRLSGSSKPQPDETPST